MIVDERHKQGHKRARGRATVWVLSMGSYWELGKREVVKSLRISRQMDVVDRQGETHFAGRSVSRA